MVYGRNISGQEFGGMYCLVLIVNSLVVSAALLRIFGQQVAEIPMVATSREYQGRGYFQGLFACVENLLSSLNVENLVLPAAEETESIWTNKFGFTKMTEQQAPESEIGGCVFCRSHDFSIGIFDERTVILCDQCEKEYHVGCRRKNGLCDLKEIPQEKWFCCNGCSSIHTAVQSCVSCGPQTIPAALSEMIRRKDKEKGIITEDGDIVEWRILSGKSRYPEHLPLLSRAAVIFRECFDPIVAKSGRDLIPVMVYGRNISGQEFGGMYCLVLIVNSLVVSAALLRIFGQQVAELPMVATSREYQGRGYFQGLFACVENLLSSLNVENLVLPAAEEAESIWTNKFGFTKMTEQQLQNYQKEVQLTIFKGTSMLEKRVPKSLSESTTLI